VLSYR